MPFTFAHPAIILPFCQVPRKWISWTGLIVGSMVPDLEYFIRFNVESKHSHTIGGLFWFDLPLAILIAFLFHVPVRSALFNNLPDPLWRRLAPFDQFNWPRYFIQNWHVVLVSVMIGAASHLAWDAFTHRTGSVVEAFPALSQNISLAGFSAPLFNVLQHTSSLLGGMALLITVTRMPAHDQPGKRTSRKYWPLVITTAATITVMAASLGSPTIGKMVVSVISATMIGLIVAGILIGQHPRTNPA